MGLKAAFRAVRLRKGNMLAALLAGLALTATAVLAAGARVAETPLGGKSGLAYGPSRLGLLRAQQLDPQGRPPTGIATVARQALPAAPLAYEPFFGVAAAGFRADNAVGSPRDAALLREALRRNPRSRESRMLLLKHALGTDQPGEAVDQLAALDRLNNGAAGQLMSGLGKAITTNRQVDETIAALRPHPELYRPFLTGFLAAQKPSALVERLVTALPPSAMRDGQVRASATALLINARAFSKARALWAAGTRSNPQTLVHSPDFADRTALPPFNWALSVNETGAAEPVAGGGLSVAYYGRRPGVLAAQLLTLAPGTYTARLEYRTLSGTPGALGLSLRCEGSETLLVERPLDAKVGAARPIEAGFTVPPDCPAQQLAVAGRIRDNRDPQEAELRRLEVTR